MKVDKKCTPKQLIDHEKVKKKLYLGPTPSSMPGNFFRVRKCRNKS